MHQLPILQLVLSAFAAHKPLTPQFWQRGIFFQISQLDDLCPDKARLHVRVDLSCRNLCCGALGNLPSTEFVVGKCIKANESQQLENSFNEAR